MILRILLMLVLIQASRAGLLSLLGSLNHSAYTYSDFLLILIGVILCFLMKPGKQLLGLNFDNRKKRDKIIYTAGTVVILLLFISSLLLFCKSTEDRIMELAAVLIFPAFEELLFRGYLWERLLESKIGEIQTYIIITVLFGLWHLGYWDIIYYRAGAHFNDINMGQIMFYKVLTGMAYGIVTGFVRIKAKNSYACFLIHSFLNIFGR